MTDNDLTRHVRKAAEEFIARYGANAVRQAAKRAEELLAAGEHEGHQLWRDICTAITALSDEDAHKPKCEE